MSNWLDESTEILRLFINDFSDDPTYADETLEQLLLVAARYVNVEANWNINYVVDFLGGTVSPDPSSDPAFLNLAILKAACLTNTWEYNKKAIMDGIVSRLGPASLSVSASSSIILGLLNQGVCKTYDELITQHNFGRGDLVRGILSPFTNSDLCPDDGDRR